MQHLRLSPLARLLTCLTLLATVPLAAHAQDRWFRVELLVFSNETSSSNEQWEPTPELDYPSAARFLIEPDKLSSNKAKYKAESMLDEFGRQFLTLPPGSRYRNANTTNIPGSSRVTPGRRAAGNASLPTPFVTLPSSQLEFRGKAAYMQRSGRYRTLFHETWAQPVRGAEQALPIVLDRSGDTGQWPRLQGSVTLYLSRYLHIVTNLWLNTNGNYLSGNWRMPAPQFGPPSVIIDGQPVMAVEAALRPPAPSASSNSQAGVPGAAQETGPVSPFRHAVLLQQKRRMRSTEVHYIDHPLLGVVVKLTPLSDEDLQSLAQAEPDSVMN